MFRISVVGFLCGLLSSVAIEGAAQNAVHRTGERHGSGMIQVMILDGQSGGTYHNWRLTTPVMKKELEETGLFSVDVVTAPPWGGDFSNFNPDLSRYQAIVMNYDAPDWPQELRTRFVQLCTRWRRTGSGARGRQCISQLAGV